MSQPFQKEELKALVKQYQDQILGISEHLFLHPELSGEEHQSVAFLKAQLEGHGFTVTTPYPELPTAFIASSKPTLPQHPKPLTIAFLAEYDALPGYGTGNSPAHACGHNWIAASACGAAWILSKLMENRNVNVMVMGTPAEETTGGKIDLIRLGAFEHIDFVIQCHPETETLLYPGALAMDALEFNFKGKSAHAAQYPHDGINALDAVQLTFAGINALRQHLKPDVRIHGIVTKGGDAPNIVPGHSSCRFYVRATEREYLNLVTSKVINCAKGAELMTGAQLDYGYFENPFDNLILKDNLQQLMAENFRWAGIDEMSFVPEALPGSSDIGNVSHVVPTLYSNIKVSHGASVHEEGFLSEICSDFAQEQLKKAVLAMAGTAFDLISLT